MSMLSALIEHQRRLDELAAIEAARIADQEAAAGDWAARQVLGATLATEALREQRRALCDALYRDSLAIAIHDLMTAHGGTWKGTVTALLHEIGLPDVCARHAGRRLRRLARVLFGHGLTIRLYQTHGYRAVAIGHHEQRDDGQAVQSGRRANENDSQLA